MNIFTKEHNELREKHNTKNMFEYYFDTIVNDEIDKSLANYLEALEYFFFATSNKNGNTNVNFKGKKSKYLIKVLDEKTLIFPDYIGNGIFHGAGDILSNPNVGLLCIDFLNDIRVKISGTAEIIDNKKELSKYMDLFDSYDIQRVIEVRVNYIIPNCSNNLSIVRESILKNYN
ncbi:pyridoxamine 5'-phosphate oxidase family protein [Arcobacter sp. YIC-80]|uniref:pyridoxamine 5'-phosphate oxidase family protein n=1 Tax=Arcobacter sp. YIC-80 TaxID=3376683 RepID=UPI0038516E05